MFCSKCGASIEDSIQFCPYCGAKNEQQPVAVPVVAPVEETVRQQTNVVFNQTTEIPVMQEEQPAKKKVNWKKVFGISIPCIVLALIIAFSGAYVGNFFVKLFTSADGYFRYVAKNNMEDAVDAYTDSYDDLLEMLTLKKGDNHLALSVELGDTVQTLLKNSLGVDASKMSEISVDLDTFANKKQVTAALDVFVGGSKDPLVSVAGGYNKKENQLAATLPELTEQWIGVAIPKEAVELATELSNTDFSKILPKGKTVKKILVNAIDGALKELDGVEQSSGTFTAGGVSQKGTMLSVELTEEKLNAMTVGFLSALKDDKTVKKAVLDTMKNVEKMDLDWKDLTGSKLPDGDDVYDMLMDGLDEAIDNLKDYEPSAESSSKNATVLNLYVDARGKIYGCEVIKETEYRKTTMVSGYARKGSDIGFEMKMVEERKQTDANMVQPASNQEIVVSGTGKCNMLGVLNGDFAVSVYGKEYVTGTFSDLKISGNRTKGKMEARLTSEAIAELDNSMLAMLGSADFGLSLDFDIGAKKQDFSVQVLQGETSLVTVGVENRVGKGKKAKLPKEDDIIFVENEADLTEFVKSIDLDELKNRLNDLGLQSVAQMLDQVNF